MFCRVEGDFEKYNGLNKIEMGQNLSCSKIICGRAVPYRLGSQPRCGKTDREFQIRLGVTYYERRMA